MAVVEIDRVAGQQPSHDVGQAILAWPQQQMEVIGHECPGEALSVRLDEQHRQALEKSSPIAVVGKDITAIDAADDDVLEQVEKIKTRCTGHDGPITQSRFLDNK